MLGTEYHLHLVNTELDRQSALLQESVPAKKILEESLQDSEKQYRQLFESARDGILILDGETGKVIDVNPFLLQLLGYPFEALYGQHIWELGVFKNIAASRDAFKSLQESESVHYNKLQLTNQSGRQISVEFISNNHLTHQSKVILCTISDITEHLRLTARLQQAQKMEAVGLLVGGVAHDYNNMLTVIVGYADLALRKADPALPVNAYLEGIIRAANHSTDITRQLLAFVCKQTITPVVVDLNQNVENMLKLLRRLIGEDIDLAWFPGKDLRPIKMDPVQADQILANLCINSRDAIADTGKITVKTANVDLDKIYCARHAGFAAGEYVLLAVSDTGCGMNKEILGRIFEPYFTSKGVDQGTGLGLSTVYGIVTQNNGFINVCSEPGKGTTVKIYLPRHTDQSVVIQQESRGETPLGRGETVLVVEDEPELLRISKMMLEDLGYRVLAAGTPGEAVRIAAGQAGKIQLLITDIVMPEMNGRDLAKLMLTLYPQMKILYMSGVTANVISHLSDTNEKVNFIQKPFSLRELAVKVSHAAQSIAV